MSELGLAIVGLGPWGRNLLRAFSSVHRARLVSVCDADASRLDSGASPDLGVRRVSTFTEVLADAAVQAIVLATPPATHADQCLAALDAGKHVFVEKPLALRSSDTARLADRVRTSQRKLMVGHILRYHPALLRLTELVSTGRLGRIQRMESIRFGTAGAAEADEEATWWTLGPHDVSAMRAIVGAEVTSISAQFGFPLRTRSCPIRATLRFSTGCSAHIALSLRAAQKVRCITVVGNRGTCVFDDLEPRDKIRIYPARSDRSDSRAPLVEDDRYELIPFSGEEPLLLEARHFISTILDDAPIPTDVLEGRAVVAALEAGHRSLRSGGRVVPICPVVNDGRENSSRAEPFARRRLQLGAAPVPEAPSSGALTSGSSDE